MPKIKKSKASQQPEPPASTHANQNKFFKTCPQTPEPQAQTTLDPTLLVVLTAILNELKEHNEIERIKLQKEEDKRQSEAESAEKEKIKDQERDSHLSRTLYM